MAQNDQTTLSGASLLATHLGLAGMGWDGLGWAGLGAVLFPVYVAGFGRQQGILQILPHCQMLGVCSVTGHIHYVVHPQADPEEICGCYNRMGITWAAFQ